MNDTIKMPNMADSREDKMRQFQEDFQMAAAKADLLGRKAGMIMNALSIGVGTEHGTPLFNKSERKELEKKLMTILQKL